MIITASLLILENMMYKTDYLIKIEKIQNEVILWRNFLNF